MANYVMRMVPWGGAGSEVPPSEAPGALKGLEARGGEKRRSEGRRRLHLRKACFQGA